MFKKMYINESVKKGILLGKVFIKYVYWLIFVIVGVKEIIWIFILIFISLVIIWFLKLGDLFFKKGIIVCIICGKGIRIRGLYYFLGDEMCCYFEKIFVVLLKVIFYFVKLVIFNIFGLC